jgi:hypothetical protein
MQSSATCRRLNSLLLSRPADARRTEAKQYISFEKVLDSEQGADPLEPQGYIVSLIT